MNIDALLSFFQEHQLSRKWRIILSIVLALLLIFHVFVLVFPFVYKVLKLNVTSEDIKHIRYVSESLSLITSALLIILLLTYGQAKLVRYFESFVQQREEVYKNISNEIIEWLGKEKKPVADENVILDTNPSVSQYLMHIKVSGNIERMMNESELPQKAQGDIQKYCEQVHYELTNYPTELLYGIHFEFSSIDISTSLCERAKEFLALERQYPGLVPDKVVPKKPGWVFLCICVELSGDFEKDLPNITTHARHFVELVGHTYDLLYSTKMVNHYLTILSKKKV